MFTEIIYFVVIISYSVRHSYDVKSIIIIFENGHV